MGEVKLAVSSLTTKFQATIPAEVRKKLKLKAGDKVGFKIRDDGQIILMRVDPSDRAYLSAVEGTLTEWNSPEDEEAFNDL